MRRLLLAAPLLAMLWMAPAVATPTQPRTFTGDARLLVDRDESWNAILDLVRSAKHSIAIDYYVLGGPRAEELAKLLAERQEEGIAIRVVLDPDMGTLPAIRAMTAPVLARLRSAHVPVRFYPREALAKLHNYRYVEDHTKVVVADGCQAFVGSMNFGAELLHNHDVGVRVDGQVAHAIANDVVTAFELAEPLGPEVDRPWPAATLPGRVGDSEITYLPTGLTGTPAREALVSALGRARHSVRVMMFELEDPAAEVALLDAFKRGVDVRVLVDPNDLDHLSPVGWCPRGVFNLGVASRLASAGVPVRWFCPGPDARQLHAKAALIDGECLFAGSTNWNPYSFDLNNETMLQIAGGRAPGRFKQIFEHDWATRSEPVNCPPGAALASQLLLYRGLAYMLN